MFDSFISATPTVTVVFATVAPVTSVIATVAIALTSIITFTAAAAAASQFHHISWSEPIVITNGIPDEILAKSDVFNKHQLSSVYRGSKLSTGNRKILICI
jgi:hypothetical protein